MIPLGCDGPPPGGTGGGGGSVGDGSIPTVDVDLRFDVDVESSSELEANQARIFVGELRVRTDVGGVDDPRLRDVGWVSFVPETELDPMPASPATYSQITIDLELPPDEGWTWELDLSHEGRRVLVRSTAELRFDLRCEAPTTVEPGDLLEISLSLNLEGLDLLIEMAGDGQADPLVIDETTEPELLSSIETWLLSAIEVSCEIDGA